MLICILIQFLAQVFLHEYVIIVWGAVIFFYYASASVVGDEWNLHMALSVAEVMDDFNDIFLSGG